MKDFRGIAERLRTLKNKDIIYFLRTFATAEERKQLIIELGNLRKENNYGKN